VPHRHPVSLGCVSCGTSLPPAGPALQDALPALRSFLVRHGGCVTSIDGETYRSIAAALEPRAA
jgi:hypothetical protein